DLNRRVIAMEQIEIEVAELHAGERIVEVGGDVEGRNARADIIVVPALGKDAYPVANAAVPNPLPDRLFTLSAVDMCSVDAGASELKYSVEKREPCISVGRIDRHRSLHQP